MTETDPADREGRLQRAAELRDEAAELRRSASGATGEQARVMASNAEHLDVLAESEEQHAPAGEEDGQALGPAEPRDPDSTEDAPALDTND